MKFNEDRPYAEPDVAGRHILAIAKSLTPDFKDRIYCEKVNQPFMHEGGSADEYCGGIKWLIAEALIEMHESGAYFLLTDKGAQVST